METGLPNQKERDMKHNGFTKVMGIAAAAAVMTGGPFAIASAAQGQLSPSEVVQKIEGAGYTKVHDVEFDDGRWEVEATSPAGVPVDLTIDATSGQIVHEEND
jgi:hypothetical protein